MSQKQQKSPPLWRSQEFAVAFLPVALLLGSIVVAYFYLDYVNELDVISTLEQNHTRLGKRSIERRIRELSKDVRVISESQILNNYINDPSTTNLSSLSLEFKSTCKYRAVFDQVRYLNTQGMEVLRVNFENGDCNLVPEDQLQNKQGRYYFKDTILLSKGEVYYSPLDLNVERGVIERPLKPMVRIGMPVFDQRGDKAGIILVNYLASELLRELEGVMASEYSTPMLLNRDGYWLLAAQDPYEWGFMFDGAPSFASEYPDVWNKMQLSDEGQVNDPAGLFSWSTVYPVEEGSVSSSGSAKPYAASDSRLVAHDYVWRVGTQITSQALEQLSSGRMHKAILLYLVLVVIAIVGSLFLAFERRRAVRYLDDLKENARQLRAITAELGEGLVVLDSDGKVTMANPQAERLLGWTEKELLGKDFHKLVHTEPGENEKNCPIQQVNETEELVQVEDDRFFTKSGGSVPVAYKASRFMIDGKSFGIIISFEDITDRKAAKAKLTHMASHDSMTGLYNRREIEIWLDRMFRNMIRSNRPWSVCLLDVDHFKIINDTKGHQVGDKVLIMLGKILKQMTRGADCCGRYGGEEFLLVLPETDVTGAIRLGELLRKRIEQSFINVGDHEPPVQITVSIGIAELNPDMGDPDQLVSLADHALYRAKNSGRNQVCAEPSKVDGSSSYS
ncbi:MAG: diguanylate cyclase [Candidatus Thiodiazotropha sp.]